MGERTLEELVVWWTGVEHAPVEGLAVDDAGGYSVFQWAWRAAKSSAQKPASEQRMAAASAGGTWLKKASS